MAKAKSKTLVKQTTFSFSKEDIEILVKDMSLFLENGEIFETFLTSDDGNEVIVTVEVD